MRSLNATMFPLKFCMPSDPEHSNIMLTDEIVFSDNCGKPWAGANTLYISKKSEEKIIGTTNWPGCHVKVGGTVSMKLLSRLSRNKSVLKGIISPAVARTLNWFGIKGDIPSMGGNDESFSRSGLVKLLSFPMFSLVIFFDIDIKSYPFLLGLFPCSNC